MVNRFSVCGQGFFKIRHLELSAEARVVRPLAVRLQMLARKQIRHCADKRDKLAARIYLADGVAVVLILKDYIVYCSFDDDSAVVLRVLYCFQCNSSKHGVRIVAAVFYVYPIEFLRKCVYYQAFVGAVFYYHVGRGVVCVRQRAVRRQYPDANAPFAEGAEGFQSEEAYAKRRKKPKQYLSHIITSLL